MMASRRPLLAMGFALALVAAACSSGTDGGAPADTTVVAAASTTIAGEPGGEVTSTTTGSTTTSTVGEAVFAGTEVIVQTTPVSGGGTRPLLEWQSVDGASAYIVTVYSETGGPYWSAVTVDTQTYVGGPLQIPEGRSGPIVSDGYTWVVIAQDTDGGLLAASPRRPISP